jgi:hypothetical protein
MSKLTPAQLALLREQEALQRMEREEQAHAAKKKKKQQPKQKEVPNK